MVLPHTSEVTLTDLRTCVPAGLLAEFLWAMDSSVKNQIPVSFLIILCAYGLNNKFLIIPHYYLLDHPTHTTSHHRTIFAACLQPQLRGFSWETAEIKVKFQNIVILLQDMGLKIITCHIFPKAQAT